MKNIRKIGVALLVTLFGSLSISAQTARKAEDVSPLLIGETLPKVSLQDSKGNDVKLHKLLKEKRSVLVFYRGGWCPYCNLQLSGLAKAEQEILNLGYQIIAISPDDYQNLEATEEKDAVKYSLLSDKDGKFIQEIGIAFKTPLMIKGFAKAKGQKGDTSDVMPVPTIMVVDTDRTILFEYINPNYKKRISEDFLLAVLRALQKE